MEILAYTNEEKAKTYKLTAELRRLQSMIQKYEPTKQATLVEEREDDLI